MRLRVLMLVLVVVLELGRGLPMAAAAGGPDGLIRYRPPVPGAVVDPWRPPTSPFGPGNRGIDLDAAPGEAVVAAAAGLVVYAGTIAGTADVVILHPDGLRTTYAFLATATVRRGDVVVRGQVVGTAAGPVHFGVRAGDEYLDPTELLFGPLTVHLVPDDVRNPQSESGERRGVMRFLSGGFHAGKDALAWVGSAAVEEVARDYRLIKSEVDSVIATVQLAALYVNQPFELLVAMRAMAAYRVSQRGCTPAGRDAPARTGRHIAILVAGFGSDGVDDAIGELDTAALGYADSDVAQFSYAGGQVAGERQLPGIPTTDGYSSADADGPMAGSADKLRELVDRVAAANPGVPIDVIGHSQGGLVARKALDQREPSGRPADAVANLITLGAPHTGSDLATGLAWLRTSRSGNLAVKGFDAVTGADLRSPAAVEMREGSGFLRDLAEVEVEAGRFTSIASAGDLMVTANHSVVGGAVNVLVPGGPGASVHDDLPGSDAVQREVALALAGLGPTCRSLWGSMAQVVAESTAEDLAAGAVGAGVHYLEWQATTGAGPSAGAGTGPG